MTTPRAATRARHAAILQLLREGITTVEDLAEHLDVSTSTVRRDLERLDAVGRVARTYGGAILPTTFQERSFAESTGLASATKQSIAQRARQLVPDSGQVFIDAGTTCGALSALLAVPPDAAGRSVGAGSGTTGEGADPAPESPGPESGLTVVTRGLETALTLASCEHVAVQMVGGRLRRLSHGLVGPLGALAVTRMSFAVAFLGADVVSPERGVGEPSQEETAIKEQVAARSARTVVLADRAKLTAPSAPAWTAFAAPWTLITDADDDVVPGLTERCATNGVELIHVPTPEAT